MARPPRLVLTLIAVVCMTGLGACGGDDDSEGSPPETATSQPDTGTATEPTPAEAQEALKDTSRRPVIPQPTGSPPRRLVVEDIVKGKGPAAKPGDLAVSVPVSGPACCAAWYSSAYNSISSATMTIDASTGSPVRASCASRPRSAATRAGATASG